MKIVHLYRCPTHVYLGHHGRLPGTEKMTEADQVRCIAGRGIEGDRYSLLPGTKGQVTFFAEETWLRLCRELHRDDRGPDVFRRNVVVSGSDLQAFIGQDFEVQGVHFRGVSHCAPCFWMDEAFSPGAFQLLKDWQAGGLRAEVLTEGTLSAQTIPCLA